MAGFRNRVWRGLATVLISASENGINCKEPDMKAQIKTETPIILDHFEIRARAQAMRAEAIAKGARSIGQGLRSRWINLQLAFARRAH
jgi:hypothetical protein